MILKYQIYIVYDLAIPRMFYLLVFDPFNPDRSVEYWGYSDMNSILDIIRDLVFDYNVRDNVERIFDHIHIFKARYGK